MKVLHTQGRYRIVEMQDNDYNLDDLKGDCYKPECNPSVNPIKLKSDENRFEKQVSEQGVFRYELQVWNPQVGAGWEHVDSCHGFVGEYDHKTNEHYIVTELVDQIPTKKA